MCRHLPPHQAEAGDARARDVFVNNIAWEATEAAVKALFAEFGSIMSLRMPRGDNPQRPNAHRGIAYITFGAGQPDSESLCRDPIADFLSPASAGGEVKEGVYSDGKVANRDSKVWRGATENVP